MLNVVHFANRHTRPSDWSNQELAEFFRARDILARLGLTVDIERGLSDEGEPWVAFCLPDGINVLLHCARFQGAYVITAPAFGRSVHGRDFRSLLEELLRSRPFSGMAAREASGVSLHPAALLVGLLFVCLCRGSDEAAAQDALIYTQKSSKGESGSWIAEGRTRRIVPVLMSVPTAVRASTGVEAALGDSKLLALNAFAAPTKVETVPFVEFGLSEHLTHGLPSGVPDPTVLHWDGPSLFGSLHNSPSLTFLQAAPLLLASGIEAATLVATPAAAMKAVAPNAPSIIVPLEIKAAPGLLVTPKAEPSEKAAPASPSTLTPASPAEAHTSTPEVATPKQDSAPAIKSDIAPVVHVSPHTSALSALADVDENVASHRAQGVSEDTQAALIKLADEALHPASVVATPESVVTHDTKAAEIVTVSPNAPPPQTSAAADEISRFVHSHPDYALVTFDKETVLYDTAALQGTTHPDVETVTFDDGSSVILIGVPGSLPAHGVVA